MRFESLPRPVPSLFSGVRSKRKNPIGAFAKRQANRAAHRHRGRRKRADLGRLPARQLHGIEDVVTEEPALDHRARNALPLLPTNQCQILRPNEHEAMPIRRAAGRIAQARLETTG